jgi:hypothetical protein
VELSLSDQSWIDERALEKHDPGRLFYFNLHVAAANGLPARTFPLHAEGDTDFKVWLDKKVPPYGNEGPGARSLGIRISAKENEARKDKIFLALVPDQSPDHMRQDAPDNRRFVSFDFMLDPGYEVPLGWAMHFQAWQRCGANPPFTMEVLPGRDRMGPINVTFGVRDDAEALKPRHPRLILYKMGLMRGEWHNIVFELAPQSDSSTLHGSLAMWFDGKKRFSYAGHWGYSPTQPPPSGSVCNDRMSLELGVYRGKQPTTQTIYFQNLRYGKDFSSVSAFPE